MKIAFDARAARENVTGVGRIVLETASGLSEKGHEITLIYDGEPNFNLEKERITKVVIGKVARNIIDRFFWEQKTLRAFLEKNSFDIFHEFWNFGIPFFYQKHSVLTVHDLVPKVWPGYYNWKTLIKEKPFYEASLAISFKKAKKILVDSENTKNDLLKISPSSEPKVLVCYAGVDHKIEVPSGENNVEIPQGNYFVYFGGIDPRKNVDLLLRAFKLVRDSFEVKLVVVGKYSGDFDPLVNELSLGNDVIFPGFLSQRYLENLISNSIGVVYPSSYEGFGFPVLEAQKNNAPVITAKNSSLVELAGESSLFVDLTEESIAEAMKKLVSDRNLRDKLVNLGKANVERFKWEESINKVEEVYKEVLHG